MKLAFSTRPIWAILTCLCLLSPATAQQSLSVPQDAKFVVRLDVDAFRNTRLGGQILELTEKLAQEELGQGDEDAFEQMSEALGFNPFEEIHALTIVGSDFEHPEESMQLVLEMGTTTGNLEGMALALPGYESDEHGDYTIHSASEDDMRAYGAIHSGRGGKKSIVAATSRDDVTAILDVMDGESSPSERRDVGLSLPKGTFIHVQILELPEEVQEVEQAANIAKMMQEISVSIGQHGDHFSASVNVSVEDEKKAEQIQQLAQGAKALVGLLEGEIEGDEEAEMALSLLKQLEVHREGNAISIDVSIPEELVIHFLREEADLPL